MLAWLGIEWWRRRPSGAGIAAGAAAGLLCYGAVHLKGIFHYDDSLDVVGVHMAGGNRLPVPRDLDHLVGHRPRRRAAGQSGDEEAGLDLSEYAEVGYQRTEAAADSMAVTPGAPQATEAQ